MLSDELLPDRDQVARVTRRAVNRAGMVVAYHSTVGGFTVVMDPSLDPNQWFLRPFRDAEHARFIRQLQDDMRWAAMMTSPASLIRIATC